MLDVELATVAMDGAVKSDVGVLLRRVFQMCDVDNRGHISVKELVQLGQHYLGDDNQVNPRA